MEKKKNNSNNLAWLMSGLFGIISGIFLVFGYQLESGDALNLSDQNALLVMAAFFIIITVDTRHVWRNYESARSGKGKLFGLISLPDNTAKEISVGSRDFLTNWGLMALLGIPVLLAEFPGFFVYDAQDELNEVLTRTFTTHHPLLHVLLLGGIIALLHKITGSWNVGIFVYILIQMLVITAIFAYVVTYLQRKGAGKRWRIFWEKRKMILRYQ